jgi:hypothetical protein
MNLEETFITKGQWWLPETPDVEVHGELRYTPENGVKLELQGDLHAPDNERFHPPAFQDAPLILGITSQGREVSLLNCIQTKGNVSSGEYIGVPVTEFRVTFAFIGVHFLNPGAVSFKKVAVNYYCLEEWMDQNPFQVDHPVRTREQPNFGEVVIRYKRPDTQRANADDFVFSFVTAGPSIERPSAGKYVLSQKASVTIQVIDGEKKLETFMGIMRRIQDFLTLGIGDPTYPVEIEGFTEVKKQVLDNGKEYYPPVQILYDRPWRIKSIRQSHPSQMLFTLKTLQGRLESCLSEWFSKAKTLKPVLDIYFSVLYREQIYIELRFLSIVQAVESYHRRVWGGKYMSDDDFLSELYPKLVQAIPADLDPGFTQSLRRGKLRYANEYSLRKRLKDLARHLAGFLQFGFLVNTIVRDAFIERVCDTRNYLTHYDPELVEKAATTGKEQYQLFEKLRAMLDALLLEQIGFEPGQIHEMIKKNRIFDDPFGG